MYKQIKITQKQLTLNTHYRLKFSFIKPISIGATVHPHTNGPPCIRKSK